MAIGWKQRIRGAAFDKEVWRLRRVRRRNQRIQVILLPRCASPRAERLIGARFELRHNLLDTGGAGKCATDASSETKQAWVPHRQQQSTVAAHRESGDGAMALIRDRSVVCVYVLNYVVDDVVSVAIWRVCSGVHIPGVLRSRCDDDERVSRSKFRELGELHPVSFITLPAMQQIEHRITLLSGLIPCRKDHFIRHLALQRGAEKGPLGDCVRSNRDHWFLLRKGRRNSPDED